MLGISSSQLTKSYFSEGWLNHNSYLRIIHDGYCSYFSYFSEGVGQPPNQIINSIFCGVNLRIFHRYGGFNGIRMGKK